VEHATAAGRVPPPYRMVAWDGPWVLFKRE